MLPSPVGPTFSVIQRTLDETITLEQLQEASMQVPTIARADCIRIHKLLAGIFISRISRPEALALQRGLHMQGIASDVVEDAQLPALPLGGRSMRVSRVEDALQCRDVMERATTIPLHEILFIAAGVIREQRFNTKIVSGLRPVGRHGSLQNVQETQRVETTETSVTLDLFFTRPPYRFTFQAGDASCFFVQDQTIRPRLRDLVAWAFQLARGWAPADCRLNRHIHHDHPLDHPVNKLTYEEEIRWRFYRLRHPA